MSENDRFLEKICEEFVKFKTTMEELRLLKQISSDLRNFREMMKLKKYD
jgi:hypothetical protein